MDDQAVEIAQLRAKVGDLTNRVQQVETAKARVDDALRDAVATQGVAEASRINSDMLTATLREQLSILKESNGRQVAVLARATLLF